MFHEKGQILFLFNLVAQTCCFIYCQHLKTKKSNMFVLGTSTGN